MPPDRSRPRQDPVSCESCRKKKLKCDRLPPCSNCRARGITCVIQGRQAPPSNESHSLSVVGVSGQESLKAENEAIRARLLRLEEIVLGGGQAPSTSGSAFTSASVPSPALFRIENHHSVQTPSTTIEHHSPDPESFRTLSGDSRWLEGVGSRENWRIPNLSSGMQLKVGTLEQIVAGSHPDVQTHGLVIVPFQDLGRLFLKVYLEKVDTLQHIIYKPHLYAMWDAIYAKIGQGEPLEHSHTALMLGIFASAAAHYSFCFDQLSETTFDSRQSAVSVSLYWLKSTFEVLEKARRIESPQLETIQATIIIMFMIFHIEVFSPKARFLHATAVVAAKEIGLHLIDSEKKRENRSQQQIINTELKRRVWWHLCATDWSIAITGGPNEGTYLINPKHMRTKKPRNITDEELAVQGPDFDRPLTDATPMSYYLYRIKLGELCREVADITWEILAGAEPEQIPYHTIIATDNKFEALVQSLPQNLQLCNENPITTSHPADPISTLRYFTNLTIHARRCKLHLPFLLRASRNPRYAFSRDQCLRSARQILRLRTMTLDTGPMVSRVPLNIFLHHFFSAILMLIMDLCVNRTNDNNHTNNTTTNNNDNDNDNDIQLQQQEQQQQKWDEIKSACTILEAAKDQSAAAGIFLDSLLTILRKHKASFSQQIISLEETTTSTNTNTNTNGSNSNGNNSHHHHHRPTNSTADFATAFSVAANSKPILSTGTTTTIEGDGEQSLDLDELWQGYLDFDTTISPHEWDALFYDLDSAI
ncbi:Hypothetical protein R9X50_00128900 [Acrodontium crateriforme]|uniref:Zn(2)-C6 fungal-type domain-containing protein n=1 Tax=Acrodontium crateriforme TaxID=150365 RepID=A0AAQ3R5P8_9PEZI|nr:Hypothetical protein R9X50_00128900 [Acrodontium crateriforme]